MLKTHRPRWITCDKMMGVVLREQEVQKRNPSADAAQESETMEKTEQPAVYKKRISVRNLVEFILRSGDIDERAGTMADPEAMQLGSRMHRKIQKRQGPDYHAEVMLSIDVPCEDFIITVEGRADGILEQEKGVTIDEIKGIFRPLRFVEEPVPVHLAQAKVYAYIYATQHELEKIKVQMTYANLETEEIKYFKEKYTIEELTEWFDHLMAEYRKWAKFEKEWREKRQESIHKTTFPYDWRDGQKDLSASVYRTIAHGKNLFIQAPTGVGKTLSTLFPAVKAMGEDKGERIFYLTARTIARTVAEEAFALLSDNGLRMKRVTLTAKEKICPLDETACNPDDCPYAKGHFDRINDAVFELINRKDCFTRTEVEEGAKEFQVCPFELSLDLSNWCDSIICDYNYVFHPRSKLKRYFGDGVKGDYLFLIDEAHNLVDRGRDMYSAQLVKEDFLALKKKIKPYSKKIATALERVNRQLLALKRECGDWQELESIGALPISLMNLCAQMEDFLETEGAGPMGADVRELYFTVRTFLDTCDRLDETYVIFDEILGDDRFRLKLFCVDPSVNLQECLNRARSTVFFSATLLPIDYYKRLLSTDPENYAVYAESVFDPANLKVMIGRDTSSKYTERGPAQYRRIASYIQETVKAKAGNYLVFFPSYRMLMDVQESYETILEEEGIIAGSPTDDTAIAVADDITDDTANAVAGDITDDPANAVAGDIADDTANVPAGDNTDGAKLRITLTAQHPGMSESQREEFLQQFSAQREDSLVGFCVMGSIFGEGIDLKNDRLIGAIVVGTGLPQVCCDQEILKRYYDRKGMDGFRFAYLCPGMNKVLQAAGRVIRTEQDKGVVVLLDRRFTQWSYREMFPREWKNISEGVLQTAGEELKKFWESI